jgi:hypothetical protein
MFIGFKSIDYFAVASGHEQARRRAQRGQSGLRSLRLTLGRAHDNPPSRGVKLAAPSAEGPWSRFTKESIVNPQ